MLAGLLVLAAALRFYALEGRGLIYWDEAKFALEGLRVQAGLQGLLGSQVSLSAGKAIGSAKPMHALLTALAYAAFGVHDYAPLLLNAAASLGEVLLVYLMGRRLFSPAVGLIGALFLAVSEYDLLYARSALSENDATVLLLGGVLLWLQRRPVHPSRAGQRAAEGRGGAAGREAGVYPDGIQMERAGSEKVGRIDRLLRERRRLLAGLLMGLAFTTNYRLIVYIGTIVAFDLIWIYWERGPRGRASGTSDPTVAKGLGGGEGQPQEHAPEGHAWFAVPAWLLGLSVAPLLWQLGDLAARARRMVLFQSDIPQDRRLYLQQVLYQLREGKQAVFHFEPGVYLQWYVVREGWPMLVLLLLGLGFALWRRSFAWLVLAMAVVIPYISYVFAPFVVPRNLVAALPFASLLAAAALMELATRFTGAIDGRSAWIGPKRPLRMAAVLAAVVACALAALGIGSSWQVTRVRSGFEQASRYVHRHGGKRALTTTEVTLFYFRGSGAHCDSPALPATVTQLSSYVRAGYRYAILDQHHTSSVTHFIRAHDRHVARYRALGPAVLPDNPISSENSNPPRANEPPEYVDVYLLSRSGLPPFDGKRSVPCDRNRIA